MKNSTNNKGFLVSIIVPAYQRDDLLQLTVASVLSQTYSNWEMLIIDDAVSEKTKQLVQSFKDLRIKYFARRGDRKGADACRNLGVKESSGTYLMFLDSDDLLSGTCLENRVNYFEKFQGLDYLVFHSAFFNKVIGDTPVLWNRFDEREDLLRFLASDVVWHTSGSFFNKESLVNSKVVFNESAESGQDWFFHLDVLLKGLTYKKIETVPDVFIRRDASQKRISDEHGDTDKICNRITLMKYLFKKEEVISDAQNKELLLKTISREFLSLLNSKRTIPDTTLRYFSHLGWGNDKLNKIFKEIKMGNFLARVHFLFYRIYKKFFFPKWITVELDNKSKYRSKMTEKELEEMKRSLSIKKPVAS